MKTMLALALLPIFLILVGCETLRGLTAKSTAEECTAAATEVVAKACKQIGDVRDKSQVFVTTVKGAAEAAK